MLAVNKTQKTSECEKSSSAISTTKFIQRLWDETIMLPAET